MFGYMKKINYFCYVASGVATKWGVVTPAVKHNFKF